jgi:hypothetical protein
MYITRVHRLISFRSSSVALHFLWTWTSLVAPAATISLIRASPPYIAVLFHWASLALGPYFSASSELSPAIFAMSTMLDITSTPWVEPLPLYSRHDPDAVSIHSAAPSYISDTPTYNSHQLSETPPAISAGSSSLLPPLAPNQQTRGLPAPRYAPGFQNRANSSVSNIRYNDFDLGSWSNLRGGTNSRQYQAVAKRRANQAVSTSATLNPPNATLPLHISSENKPPAASSTNVNAYPVTVGSSSEPFHPLEDPHLVGEAAAGRARAQRIYREMCLKEDETARWENKSWEFMLGQMSDWEEREQSQRNYKRRKENSKFLGRRFGRKR